MATCPDGQSVAHAGAGDGTVSCRDPCMMRDMPPRAPRRPGSAHHHHHDHHGHFRSQLRSSHSTSLSLRGGEWRPNIMPSAPEAELAEEQTFAEFALLNLGSNAGTRCTNGGSSAIGRGAEESLVSIAAKRSPEARTPDNRPSKRQRGLAGALVDGAVHAAHAWWSSWTQNKDEVDQPSDREAPATPDAPVILSTPTRVVHPTRAVYLSSRRRRALVPSTQRRRAATARPAGKDAPCSRISRSSRSSRSSSPYPLSGSVVADTPAGGTPCKLLTSFASHGSEVHAPAAQEGSSLEPGQPDAALERMQSRLDSMIAQCQTALSSQPDAQALESVMAEDAALFPLPSSPLLSAPGDEEYIGSPLFSSAAARVAATALPSTPTLYTHTDVSRQRAGLTPTPTPTPSRGRTSLSAQGPTPSRIPVSFSRVHPPTASTFAFQLPLRPSSRASVRAADLAAGGPRSRSRPASTTPVNGSPLTTSPRKLGHRPALSASASAGPACASGGFAGFASPSHAHSPRSPSRMTGAPAHAQAPLARPPQAHVYACARSGSRTPLSPRRTRSSHSSAPPVHPSNSVSTSASASITNNTPGSPHRTRRP